jgi:tryptophanase
VRDARGFFPGLDDEVLLDTATVGLAPVSTREAVGRILDRALEAVAQGLREAVDHEYLRYRVGATEYLGEALTAAGIPIVQPPIPRRTYTQSHVDYVIEVCSAVAERRSELPGLRMTFEPPSLRHVTARFGPVAE